MSPDPHSVAIGILIGLVVLALLSLIAAQMYAAAIADGRDGEAGLWAWLGFNF